MKQQVAAAVAQEKEKMLNCCCECKKKVIDPLPSSNRGNPTFFFLLHYNSFINLPCPGYRSNTHESRKIDHWSRFYGRVSSTDGDDILDWDGFTFRHEKAIFYLGISEELLDYGFRLRCFPFTPSTTNNIIKELFIHSKLRDACFPNDMGKC